MLLLERPGLLSTARQFSEPLLQMSRCARIRCRIFSATCHVELCQTLLRLSLRLDCNPSLSGTLSATRLLTGFCPSKCTSVNKANVFELGLQLHRTRPRHRFGGSSALNEPCSECCLAALQARHCDLPKPAFGGDLFPHVRGVAFRYEPAAQAKKGSEGSSLHLLCLVQRG